MTRVLFAPSNSHVSSITAKSSPEPHPPPPQNPKIPKIKKVGKQSDWNTQNKKPPESHRALSKEVNVHTKQAGAKAKRNKERRKQRQLLESPRLLNGFAGFLDCGFVHCQSYTPSAHF